MNSMDFLLSPSSSKCKLNYVKTKKPCNFGQSLSGIFLNLWLGNKFSFLYWLKNNVHFCGEPVVTSVTLLNSGNLVKIMSSSLQYANAVMMLYLYCFLIFDRLVDYYFACCDFKHDRLFVLLIITRLWSRRCVMIQR